MTRDASAFAETVVDDADKTAQDPSPHSAPTPLPASDPETREILAGRWEILGLVGSGGMGTVYRARDHELDEIVALKVLRAEVVGPAALERFRREVKLARRVSHKNVARVFEFGEHEGRRFFTMELVEGESLRATLDRRGPPSVARVVEIGATLARALTAAHDVGVVHRDLKPDNVLVGADDRLAITDFGIAASLDAAQKGHITSQFLGTPHYMAPEQVDSRSAIDARTDVYALGAVLYELLTGQPPFDGETALAVAVARLMESPKDPRALRPDVPGPLAELVVKCMARSQDDRFSSAAEVEAALASVEAGAGARSIRPAPASRPAARSSGPLRLVRVAVMPLQGDGELAELSEGLTDDLIDSLSMVPGLRVVARDLTRQHASRRELDLRGLGSELRAEVLVEGSLRRASADELDLRVRLISVRDGIQLWARKFRTRSSALLGVNDEVAGAIAEGVLVEAAAGNERRLSDPIAVELYLKARSRYRQFWVGSVKEAVELFEQALLRAPDDPLLVSGHALALARYAFFNSEILEAAEAAAQRAIQIAPELGEAHLAVGAVALQRSDVERAYLAASAALARAPTLADAHLLMGRILGETGPLELATRSVDLARELDPTSELARREHARLFALERRWDEAHALVGTRLDVAHADLFPRIINRLRFALWKGNQEEIKALRAELAAADAKTYAPTLVPFIELVGHAVDTGTPVDPMVVADLLDVYGNRGSGRRVSFFQQIGAEVCARLGLVDAAFKYIGQSIDSGLVDLVWIERCPVLDPLRADPRFAPLRERLVARVGSVPARAAASARGGSTSW
ncbi:MAG: protein kinase [Polyangiaceae bacterium]|nr:protein kinase [Polyangiaceae bacterium]